MVYIMDTVRSTNPVTFMSNMLYACSILYKTKLPFIVAMNKVDVVDNKYAVEWMEDFDVFQVCSAYLTDKSNILLRIILYSSTLKFVNSFVELTRKRYKRNDRMYQTLRSQCPLH